MTQQGNLALILCICPEICDLTLLVLLENQPIYELECRSYSEVLFHGDEVIEVLVGNRGAIACRLRPHIRIMEHIECVSLPTLAEP
jgi:hypothetical protein